MSVLAPISYSNRLRQPVRMPAPVSVLGAGQLQQPPPQHPPPAGAGAEAEPVSATVVSSLTVSVCPSGQGAGALDSAIGRWSSNVSVQSRQR